VGIINHEQQTENYYVKLTIDDVPTSLKLDDPGAFVLGPIILQPEQQWENAVNIVPEKIGDNQKLELSLYKGTDKTSENSLHFWINVKATN